MKNSKDSIVVTPAMERFMTGMLESGKPDRVEIGSEYEYRISEADVAVVAKSLGIVQYQFVLYGLIKQGLVTPIDKNGGVLEICTLECLFKRGVVVFRLEQIPFWAPEGKDGVLCPFVLGKLTVVESEKILVRAMEIFEKADCATEDGWVEPPHGGTHHMVQEKLEIKNPLWIKPILDRLVGVGCLQDNGGVRSYKRWRVARQTTVSQSYVEEAMLLAMGPEMTGFEEIVDCTPALTVLQQEISALNDQIGAKLMMSRDIIRGKLREKEVLGH